MEKLEILELLAKVIVIAFIYSIFFGLSDTLTSLLGLSMVGLSVWGLLKSK